MKKSLNVLFAIVFCGAVLVPVQAGDLLNLQVTTATPMEQFRLAPDRGFPELPPPPTIYKEAIPGVQTFVIPLTVRVVGEVNTLNGAMKMAYEMLINQRRQAEALEEMLAWSHRAKHHDWKVVGVQHVSTADYVKITLQYFQPLEEKNDAVRPVPLKSTVQPFQSEDRGKRIR